MDQEALYPFGYGLSYTEFTLSAAAVNKQVITPEDSVECRVRLKNTGKRNGAETVQIYVKDLETPGAPRHQLKGLKRVFLKAGEETEVCITLSAKDFALYDEEGKLILNAGNYAIFIGTGQPDKRSIALTGRSPEVFKVHCENRSVLEQ
jgi:beta-glucosidase